MKNTKTLADASRGGGISKDEWVVYEKDIIERFYHEKPIVTPIIPSTGKPSTLIMSKVVVVLVLDPQIPIKIGKGMDLPDARKLELFNIGKKKIGNESTYGFKPAEGDKGVFHHPATDTGGPTAYRQPLGKKQEFLLKKHIDIGSNLESRKPIYETWLKLSNKKQFEGGIWPLFNRWLVSCQRVAKKEGTVARINFVRLPDMHRIVVSRDDIEREMGVYYLKVYGSKAEGGPMAVPAPPISESAEKLFTAVTEKYVNTDIRRRNLVNEYASYSGFKGKRVPKRKI